MADKSGIIKLYTELAQNPTKDFGWDKGLENAKAHGYKQEWIDAIDSKVWDLCAAVGNPFTNAEINEGNIVLDLGCGAGVDVLVASHLVGKSGKVFGVDITPKMVEVATLNAQEIGAANVKIFESSFDNVALEDESVDVVISNGAINLTSCKESVFAEIYRVLKPNGKIYFADMIDISIDEGSCCSVEQSVCCSNDTQEDWANCVAGTMRESELLELIQKAGFEEVFCTGHTHYKTAETTQGATFKASKMPAESLREKHWNSLYARVDYTQVLWHQNSPQKSFDMINRYATKESSIIDVGAGASLLVDRLLEKGYCDITLLDTSKTALDIVKNRVNSDTVEYICSDILNFKTEKKFNIWHDRAVFHFLLTKEERSRYFTTLLDTLEKDGVAIISTFSLSSQIQCAGLDTVAYDEKKMKDALPKGLKLVQTDEFIHLTPKDSE